VIEKQALARRHHSGGVERRVGPHHDESTVPPGVGALGGVHTAGHEPGRTPRRAGRASAEQGPGRGGDGAERCVSLLTPL